MSDARETGNFLNKRNFPDDKFAPHHVKTVLMDMLKQRRRSDQSMVFATQTISLLYSLNPNIQVSSHL